MAAVGLTFRKILLLMWKNLILHKRHYCLTATQIILPTLIGILVVACHSKLGKYLSVRPHDFNHGNGNDGKADTNEIRVLNPKTEYEINNDFWDPNSHILFTPNTSAIRDLMSNVTEDSMLIPFNTVNDMEDYVVEEGIRKYKFSGGVAPPRAIGIVFTGSSANTLSGSKISYQIRFVAYGRHGIGLPSTKELFGSERGDEDKYLLQGFIRLQIVIDKNLIERFTKSPRSHAIMIQEFPHTTPRRMQKAYIRKEMNFYIVYFVYGYLLAMALIFIIPFLIMNPISEKSTGIKELMKMMGLPNWMHWFGWFIDSLMLSILITGILIALLFYPFGETKTAVFAWSEVSLWSLALLLYFMAATSFCFFLSAVFQKHVVAITVGVILWLVTFLAPGYLILWHFNELSFVKMMALALMPNTAFYMLIDITCSFEIAGVGARWSNIAQTVSPTNRMTMGYVLMMLIVDTVVYMLLAVYLENIIPSEFGLRKPPHYPFLASSWSCCKCSKDRRVRTTPTKDTNVNKGFEPEPENLPVGIEIHKLSKRFGRNKVAVDEVSLKIYDGQITALLGHNGAGKTTTMSMLTGLFAPSSGTAFVNGFDIRTHMNDARQSMGLCPQHNMLFDKLTVEEHLTFFGKLKGLKSSEAASEINYLLQSLQLLDKRHTLSKNISGGQKRKLCLGIALIGGSKIVILDEPTSGMDPEARRAIWDLLLGVRNRCTMLLTTHFMEEADVLGDRIAIMAEGKVRCCGTPTFLKKYFGAGWTLKMTLTNTNKATYILGIVQKHIVNASFKDAGSPNSSEVSITIPNEGNVNAAFPQLFTELSNIKESTGIKTIGISLTTMDDVFVRVGEENEAEEQKLEEMKNLEKEKSVTRKSEMETLEHEALKNERVGKKGNHKVLAVENPREADVEAGVGQEETEAKFEEKNKSERKPSVTQIASSEAATRETPESPKRPNNSKRLTGLNLWLLQFYGLFCKRVLYTFRKWKLTISQLLIPLLLLIYIVYQLEPSIPSFSFDESNLKMTLSSYKNPVTLFSESDPDLGKVYKKVVGASARSTFAVIDALKSAKEDDGNRFSKEYIVAGKLDATNVTALFSTHALHSLPLSVNLMSNAILRNMGKKSRIEVPSIEVSSKVILSKFSDMLEPAKRIQFWADRVGIFPSVTLITGLAVFYAAFIIAPVEERLCQAKQLQLMTGVSPILYWASFFVWDFVLLFILLAFMLPWFPIFQTHMNFLSYYGGVFFVLMFLLYGFACIPFSYLCSMAVKSVGGGFTLVLLIHIATGVIMGPAMYGAELLDGRTWYTMLPYIICAWSPSFWASLAINQFIVTATKNNICTLMSESVELYCTRYADVVKNYQRELFQCCPDCHKHRFQTCFQPKSYMSWTHTFVTINPFIPKQVTQPGMAQLFFYLLLLGICFITLILIIEFGLVKKFWFLLNESGKTVSLPPSTDEDVQLETERVTAMMQERRMSEDALLVDNLSKNFDSFAAVSGLTFGVHYGECFGLLGVNGAGKTTSFRMLTGDETPTIGNAFAMNCALTESPRQFYSLIGYCPQFDAIVGVLTGIEMLNLFGRLRGVSCSSVKGESVRWLSRLGLLDSGKVQCKKYSGGMKRRLSAAMALIGDPPIILLDEPTSGVDPVARRQFWKVISTVKESGQAVILTSHSMDECEALCARLGIMVNGQFQCFGGVEHLKQKFAQGFSLTFTLKPVEEVVTTEVTALYEDINVMFYPCTLKDQHGNMFQYHVLNTAMSWGQIFTMTEELKAKYPDVIEDYTVKETTLEEVFLSFARMQYPERKVGGTGCFACCFGK